MSLPLLRLILPRLVSMPIVVRIVDIIESVRWSNNARVEWSDGETVEWS